MNVIHRYWLEQGAVVGVGWHFAVFIDFVCIYSYPLSLVLTVNL